MSEKALNDVVDEIIELDDSKTDNVVDLYIRVFAGHPWHEVFKCESCGTAYHFDDCPACEREDKLPDDALRIAREGTCYKNEECGEALSLVPFYSGADNLGEDIFSDALEKGGFIGVAGVLEESLVGFSWGYGLQKEDTPSVLFTEVRPMIESQGYNPDEIFYAAETGVDAAEQGKGIGTRISSERIARARDAGNQYVTFRTKNPKLLRLFDKMFGEGNVTEIFEDPNPAKAGTMWYICDVDTLQV